MTNKKIISPIAIDFGAKKSGVYYAKYPQFSHYSKIQAFGQELEFDKYTALLKDRTSNRHTRRRYQRLKFVKRLISVILKEHFQFPAEDHLQAIGFLLNRRGFSSIDGEFNREYFKKFPKKSYEAFPDAVKKLFEYEDLDKETIDISEKFEELTNHSDLNTLKQVYEKLYKKNKSIAKEIIYFDYLKKIKESSKKRIKDIQIQETKTEKKKLSKTSQWIIDRLSKELNIRELQELCKQKKPINFLNYLNQKEKDSLILKQLSKLSFETEQKKAKASIWNFKCDTFDLTKEEKNETFNSESKGIKTHLQHFCYAIYKVYDEKVSGALHRSKFFEDIEKCLNTNKQNPQKLKHQYFKHFLQEIDKHPQLDRDKIYKLICHISNFELRTLRAYFNNKSYKDGKDVLDIKKLKSIFNIWILKHWRVTQSKDGQKKLVQYKDLKTKWKSHKNHVIDFWLKTDPILTIPPYQSMTNRHPPLCQTLLLNEDYLNKHYPNWEKWLNLLKKENTEKYSQELKIIKKRSKNNSDSTESLINTNENKLRILQFIMDRSQKIDSNKLNKIWSAYHKIQQIKDTDKNELTKWEDNLKKLKNKSSLSDELKKDLEFEKQRSFGHFLNKYYQTRKKTRESRYFLFQKKKNKWDDTNKFLTTCKHKPRQKKYQMLIDLSSIFGLTFQQIEKQIEEWQKQHSQNNIAYKKTYKADNSEIIEQWILSLSNKKLKSLKSLSQDASKKQKDYKGGLKSKIDQLSKELTIDKFKGEDKKLYNLILNCKKQANQIAKKLWPKLSEIEQDQKARKFNSLFSFAQIHNIVFRDRSGFSNTCPVCSIDNSLRMYKIERDIATANRLSGLKIRIIDGVVMRICEVLSEKISNTLWDNIKSDLQNGNKITVPIILEENQFEFEPSLKAIKGKGGKNKSNEEELEKAFKQKEERIKEYNTICPYDGIPIGPSGEIDHIIPRASKYGELNDEANLIYASKLANQGKKESQYTLDNLHQKYKETVFKEFIKDNNFEEIKKFIYNHLEENPNQVEEKDRFKFGKYINFSNLKRDDRIAFRHALFLPKNDLLRKKVIRAIQNRNKTIVNGTQRYLAQCIADKIYKKAKNIKLEKLIDFDYFEYPSNIYHPKNLIDNQKKEKGADFDFPKSVYGLRKYYEKHSEKLKEKAKEAGKEQKSGSHVIDAQMAFLLATEDHKNKGTVGISFGDRETIEGGFKNPTNSQDNKLLPLKIYTATAISDKDIKYITLNRKQSKKGYRFHRSFHRSNFYAQHFVPLIIYKKDNKIKIKAGFTINNSSEIKKLKQSIFDCLVFCKNKKIQEWANQKITEISQTKNHKTGLENLYHFLKTLFPKQKNIFYINWDKHKIHEYFVREFSTLKNKKDGHISWNEKIKFLDSLSYITKKTSIQIDKSNQIKIDDKKFEIKINKEKLTVPFKKEWDKLSKEWSKQNNRIDESNDTALNKFLKEYFKTNQEHFHQKARKDFSLPVVDESAHYLQRRKSWNKKMIYQISADSDSRKDNNKFSRIVFCKKTNSLKEMINTPFLSEDIFKLKEEKINYDNFINIDPNKWIEINKESIEHLKADKNKTEWPKGIDKIEYRIYNVTRPKVKLTLKEGFNSFCKETIKNNDLIKPNKTKDKDLEDLLKNNKNPLIYTGSSFNQTVKKAIDKELDNQTKKTEKKT